MDPSNLCKKGTHEGKLQTKINKLGMKKVYYGCIRCGVHMDANLSLTSQYKPDKVPKYDGMLILTFIFVLLLAYLFFSWL